jgi:hypothetical protein
MILLSPLVLIAQVSAILLLLIGMLVAAPPRSGDRSSAEMGFLTTTLTVTEQTIIDVERQKEAHTTYAKNHQPGASLGSLRGDTPRTEEALEFLAVPSASASPSRTRSSYVSSSRS